MREAMNRLQEAAQHMGQAAYEQAGPQTDGQAASREYGTGEPGGEDVVEGEFRQV